MPKLAEITLDALSHDPYPIYATLRESVPVAWLPDIGIWFITRYHDVHAVLLDADGFVTGTKDSLIGTTFGEQMLAAEGSTHRRYRDGKLQAAFMPRLIGTRFGDAITRRAQDLVDAFLPMRRGDLRPLFAARLPVLVMLDLFGLPDRDEPLFRAWYDSFEAALANFAGDAAVRRAAARDVAAFHDYFQPRLEHARRLPTGSMLDELLRLGADRSLDDAAIRRNALILFFGGISTVEALVLNSLWALAIHPEIRRCVLADRTAVGAVLDETMRWLSPVQSATRHATRDHCLHGVTIPAGETVNCMIGSANRDPRIFDEPDRFLLNRRNAARHLGFATGPHSCIGQHLAHAEAAAALKALFDRMTHFELVRPTAPSGHEFRQPQSLELCWEIAG